MSFCLAFIVLLLLCSQISLDNAASWRDMRRINIEGNINIGERIYGGQDAFRGQFPFMAAVVLDDVALCGGSLISSTTVLTAARCVMGFEKIVVHLGVHNLTDDAEEGRLTFKASKLIPHKNFDSDNLDNDVGLIKLPVSIEASHISPVALPSRSMVEGNSFENYTASIFGWGISPGMTEFQEILQVAESVVISNKECDELYPFVPYVTPFKICLDNFGESGGCLGDSGGPAVIQNSEDANLVQIGIISFSAGKCGHNLPLILTRISEYLDWLEENAGITIEQ